MPSWKIHLATANMILEFVDYKLDKDKFILGNILPDVLNGYTIEEPSCYVAHEISHYYNDDKGNIRIPDMKMFIKQFPDFLENDVAIGYYIHLWTDALYNQFAKDELKDCEDINKNHFKQHDFRKFGDEKEIEDKIIIPNINDELVKNAQEILPVDKIDLEKSIDFIYSLGHKYENDDYFVFDVDKLKENFYWNIFVLTEILRYHFDQKLMKENL